MGQLCSRPRTAEDKHAADAEDLKEQPGHIRQNSISPPSPHIPEGSHHQAAHERQPSDAELSELDVVVQQIQNNQNSVSCSAPELLQQWDHDHRVVLQSIDASIQVCIKAAIPYSQYRRSGCSTRQTNVCLYREPSTNSITGRKAMLSPRLLMTYLLSTCTQHHRCHKAS